MAVALHQRFEWDPAKADANLVKHGVSFTDALRVLTDAEGPLLHVEEYDDRHSFGEHRWITTGSDPGDRAVLLRVIWTERGGDDDGRVTRIISARHATAREKREYEEALRP